MTGDAQDIPYPDEYFDTVVSTMTLEATYNLQAVLEEMKRVCKEGGKILLMDRGASKIAPVNEWLNFSAARDLTLYGRVENTDFD